MLVLIAPIIVSLKTPPVGRSSVPNVSGRSSTPAAYVPNEVPSFDELLDHCIVNAGSEDEVQACIQQFSAAVESMPEPTPKLSALDECIVNAASEDEVQACIGAARYCESRTELAKDILACRNLAEVKACVTGSEWSDAAAAPSTSVSVAPHTLVEECIVNAGNEDEVKACLEIEDGSVAAAPLDALDECILSAPNEDGVQACLQAEEERVRAFKKLRASLADKFLAAACDVDMEACIREVESQLA